MAARHRVTAGRHLGVGRLVRLKQDIPFYLNPCLSGNCPEGPTCDHPGTSPDGTDCCDDILGGLSVGEEDNTKSAADVRLMTSRGALNQTNGGNVTDSFFGLGAINLLVPSHTQIFSENRNAHNDAGKNHSPVINISGNLGYARYRKGVHVHDPMPTASYDEVKKIIGSTPAMSMGESSFRIDGVKTNEDSGGVAFSHDNRVFADEPEVTIANVNEDPRFDFDDVLHKDRGASQLTLDRNNSDILGRGTGAPFNRGGAVNCCNICCGDGWHESCACAKELNDPNCDGCASDATCSGDRNNCCPPPRDPCESVPCGFGCECRTIPIVGNDCVEDNYICDCPPGPCDACPDCCIDGVCGDEDECGVCNGNGKVPCDGGRCPSQCKKADCQTDLGCGCGNPEPVVCTPDNPCGGGCGGECTGEIICENGCDSPGCEGECEPLVCGVCGGPECDKGKNECCEFDDTGVAGCTWCDDCIPNQEVILKSGEVESIRGNYKDHDLVPMLFINHDLNAGLTTESGQAFSGNAVNQSAIGPRDTVMSCVLELTVADVFGRVAFTGAVPFVHPLKLSVYKSKKNIDNSIADCTYWGVNPNTGVARGWTNQQKSRNATDRVLTPSSSVTVGEDVKPGDKIYFDLSQLARDAVHNNEGKMNLIIEASDWFAESTGLAAAGRSANHPSMLLKFHAEGVSRPTVKTTVNQGLRPATSRLNPAVLRRREITAGL